MKEIPIRQDALAERSRPPIGLSTIAKLSAGVGNSEAKAGLFFLMIPGEPYTAKGLYLRWYRLSTQ